ncbi:MAG: glycosyltransferase [Chitinophagaceae bacterium]|nr:MAG: glycosyltransferase [Chitinophagaceae bacterium]
MKTIQLLYIGNKLSQHGFTKTTIETLGSFLEQEGYRMRYASNKKNQMLRFLDMAWAVVQNRKTADFVIIDTYSTFSFYYAWTVSQLCRLFGLKYIPILHGGNLPHRLSTHPKLAKMIFNHAFVNVAPSGYLKAAFEERGFTKLLFIPNTLNLEDYPFQAERATTVPKLLWVRSFAHLYNPKMAIDVLKQLKQTHPQAQLCMVGPDKDGSLQATRKYAHELGVAVTFTGKMSKEDWIKKSQEYNIFINTTNFDNTPVSVMEAMCLGLPVVTTNVGGIPFLLAHGKTALLVEAGNVLQMTQAIQNLMDDQNLRNSLIYNGRAYAEHFDWKKVKEQWARLFKD